MSVSQAQGLYSECYGIYFLAQSYKKMYGKKCESRSSLYTARSGDCDGWEGISLSQCEAKCTQNEVPSKCQQNGVKCKYFQYNTATKWCHLADATCKPVQGDKVTLAMKEG